MSAIQPTKSTKSPFPPTDTDLEPHEPQKSSPKISKPSDGETTNVKTSNSDLSERLEIPSLDDMTAGLLSDEVIDKDNFPQLPSKYRNSNIPEIQQGRADFDGSQIVLRRTRDNIDANLSLAQSMQEETRREVDMLFKIAQTLAANGEYAQAINCYNKIITLNEKSGPAWIAKGHCYAMQGQDFKALTTYQEALKAAPSSQNNEQVWYGIGLLYQKFEDWNNAENSFKNALRLEPEINLKAEILYNLGMVLKSKTEYAESAKTLTNSILTGVFPPTRMVDILCQNGNVQEKMNDMEGALKTYKYALMIEENSKPLLCAGWLCFQLDKIEQSLAHMKKAESLVPDDLNISYVIARCHLKLKQHTTAYDCLHRCLSKEPTNAVYWGSLGILFAELNQLKQAYESLSKALKLDPKCPENFYNLGCLFELSGQPNDAVSMYEKCIDLSPNFNLALNRIRLVHISQKSGSVEVQFKHAPFILNLNKDVKVEKPLFSFAQPGAPILPTREKSLGQEFELAQAQRLKEASIKQTIRENNELLKLKEQQSAGLKPVRLDQFSSKLMPMKNISETRGSVEQDVSSLKLSRPLLSDQNKLPSVQSLNSSLGGLNSFSFLQNNYNNSLGESDTLLPNRAKTDELAGGMFKGAPTDLAKQLSGLQALIAKNNVMLQSNVSEGLRPIKNVSSPIVIKPKDGFKRIDNQSEIKLNGHSALKITHKLNKSDPIDEEEPEIQKKVKLQTSSKSTANVPAEN